MRCLLTPETSSVKKMSLIRMKNNEQCIMNLSLGHNPELRNCSRILVGDTEFCLSKKLMLKLKGLTATIQHHLLQFSGVFL